MTLLAMEMLLLPFSGEIWALRMHHRRNERSSLLSKTAEYFPLVTSAARTTTISAFSFVPESLLSVLLLTSDLFIIFDIFNVKIFSDQSAFDAAPRKSMLSTWEKVSNLA